MPCNVFGSSSSSAYCYFAIFTPSSLSSSPPRYMPMLEGRIMLGGIVEDARKHISQSCHQTQGKKRHQVIYLPRAASMNAAAMAIMP